MTASPLQSPRVRIPIAEIADYAGRYADVAKDAVLEDSIPEVQARGCLTSKELVALVRWKSARVVKHARSNPDELVEEITEFALSAKSEQARIQTLTVLSGVSWPMASVILHFYHRDIYPILDFRALWSLGIDVPTDYKYPFWWAYVERCRELVQQTGLSARTVDRGLWQYSKEHQEKGKSV